MENREIGRVWKKNLEKERRKIGRGMGEKRRRVLEKELKKESERGRVSCGVLS